MVGIWGVGGGGKTTLATSVYMEIKDRFQGHCIVDNIREESSKSGRTTLQEKILSTLLKTKEKVQNEEEGKRIIKNRLCRSNVLILLDDVDDCKQLEVLVGSKKWFGDGSRIIITTRDVHLLNTHRVDYVSPVKLLVRDEAIRLFKRHAYNETDPVKGYETLSLCVVSYSDGLPLALKVLGSFLYDKDEKEWMSTLDRLKDIPESKIVEKLKISYDGLKTVEKELFLDIACFFRWRSKNDAMEIFEACGFHPDIGIKVLIQKALITIDSDGKFDMHDLVQEMGHYIVRGEHPNNPEKHSRVWKREDMRNMCLGNTTMENDKTEVIYTYSSYDIDYYSKIVPNMKKLRWLIVRKCSSEAPTSLSNELRYIDWNGYPGSRFPENFEPTNLAVLKMYSGLQKELWKGWKHLPHLKVLQLFWMENLVSTPDFDGLPSLQKLTISGCDKLEEIHPSLGNHKSLKDIRVDCWHLKKFPRIDHMKKHENLHISSYYFSTLDLKLSQLTVLVHLDLSNCIGLEKLPEFPPSLVIFVANECGRLTDVGDSIRNCKWLCQVSVRHGAILNDGDRLLQSMLQGKAIENHSMFLILEGLQIPREFQPRLSAGTRCTVHLPENWCNNFCGFLMCAVIKEVPICGIILNPKLTMKQERGGSIGIDSQVWKESVDDKRTWVGYVSFGSFRHTATWLDETCKTVSFRISIQSIFNNVELCSGFGVILVPRISGSGPTDTSPPEYYDEDTKKKYDFKPEFKIKDDLTCNFQIPSIIYPRWKCYR